MAEVSTSLLMVDGSEVQENPSTDAPVVVVELPSVHEEFVDKDAPVAMELASVAVPEAYANKDAPVAMDLSSVPVSVEYANKDAPVAMELSSVPVSEEYVNKDAPVAVELPSVPVPVEQQPPSVVQDLEQFTAQVEVQLDQVTFQLVEEGTKMVPGPSVSSPLNTDNASAAVEQQSTGNEPVLDEPVIIEERTERVETVTYEIIKEGTRRARAKLFDSNGYSYNIKTESAKVTYWQCTVRPKLNRCKASVVQRGDVFQLGHHSHNHHPKVGAATNEKIASMVKKKALSNLLKPAPAIVKEVIKEEFGDIPLPTVLKPDCLARIANRARQSVRSQDPPKTLAFELDEDHIPQGFLKGDIVKQGRRHLIFATGEQLRLLRKAKNWYIDQTFQFCPEKFEQLFTISAFVSLEDDEAKQVPLVFVLMSGSEKKDYRKVLKQILEILPTLPAVRKITAFYEQALWTVLQRLLPDVTVKGCVYHWTQVAWKTVQELGLQMEYNNDKVTNIFLRKVLALPFLPHEEIQPTFVRLWVQATTAPLQLFIQYVSSAWIYNTAWPPSTWSVFSALARSYKDVEGWRQVLKTRSSSKGRTPAEKKLLNVYLLVNLLHQEVCCLTPQTKALSEKKLLRIRNQKSRSLQAKLFQNWEDYSNQTKSAAQLLKACADVTVLYV